MKIRWNSMFTPGETVEIDVPTVEEQWGVHRKLEQIFRACNRVDDSEVEVVPDGYPSMTAGDLVWVGKECWYCAVIGWRKVEDESVLDEFLSLSVDDRCFKAPFKVDGELISKYALL